MQKKTSFRPKKKPPHQHADKKSSGEQVTGELVARRAALECLLQVVKQNKALDYALEGMRRSLPDDHNDRAFAEHLVRCVLKNEWRMRPYISDFLVKPWSNLPRQAQLLLCMATAQIHLMNTPAYAAVNTSVELAKRCGMRRLSGMMNVVLKQISRTSFQRFDTDIVAQMPTWLSERLSADYGEQATRSILQQLMQDVAHLDITYPNAPADVTEAWQADAIAGDTLRIASRVSVSGLDGYEDGGWWVQDLASAYPLHAIKHLLRNANVLDVCAAPGGKTMQAIVYGATVDALDRSAGRLKRLQENLARNKMGAGVIEADALHADIERQYDVVILDAPCSATGTLRRNPDILYHRDHEDIINVADLQRRLLARSTAWVKPGGYLLYAVCSLFKAEGEARVDALLEENPAMEIVPFKGMDEMLVNARGQYRALPYYYAQSGGMDGFFACLLRRKP